MDQSQIVRIAARLAELEAHRGILESGRNLVTPETATQIRSKFPGIPEDYIEYLQRVGAGSFLSCSYSVYSTLMKPEDIFDSNDSAWPKDLLIFGDNFSGDLGVFAPSNDWAVGELWHDDRTIIWHEKTFSSFLETLIEDLAGDDPH